MSHFLEWQRLYLHGNMKNNIFLVQNSSLARSWRGRFCVCRNKYLVGNILTNHQQTFANKIKLVHTNCISISQRNECVLQFFNVLKTLMRSWVMVPLYWSHYNMFYFCFSLFCHFFSCTVLCFLLLLFCLCRRICPSVFFLSGLLSCYRKNIFSMYFCCSRCSIQKTKLGHVGGDVEEKIKLHIYSHLDSSGCKSL